MPSAGGLSWFSPSFRLPPCAWAFVRTGEVADGGVYTEVRPLGPGTGPGPGVRHGVAAVGDGLVVAGVGALVLVYCAWYFDDDDAGLGRVRGQLRRLRRRDARLVLADDLLLLYVFWELTTVFSYLLIGHDPTRRASRRAALQALIVTTFGGLAMLVGILMLGSHAGTLPDQRAARRPAARAPPSTCRRRC